MIFPLIVVILSAMPIDCQPGQNQTDVTNGKTNMDYDDSALIQFQKFLVSFLRFLLVGLRGILTLFIIVLRFFEAIFVYAWKFYLDTGYVTPEATWKVVIAMNELFV